MSLINFYPLSFRAVSQYRHKDERKSIVLGRNDSDDNLFIVIKDYSESDTKRLQKPCKIKRLNIYDKMISYMNYSRFSFYFVSFVIC